MSPMSRLQSIVRPASGPERRRSWRAVRVVVSETEGINLPRVVLSPGDRLVIENRTRRTLRIAPLDFFGNAFRRIAVAPERTSPPMVVTGLWFQVELHADGGRFYPLDVYLAPNTTA